jgi:hypothetical protein
MLLETREYRIMKSLSPAVLIFLFSPFFLFSCNKKESNKKELTSKKEDSIKINEVNRDSLIDITKSDSIKIEDSLTYKIRKIISSFYKGEYSTTVDTLNSSKRRQELTEPLFNKGLLDKVIFYKYKGRYIKSTNENSDPIWLFVYKYSDESFAKEAIKSSNHFYLYKNENYMMCSMPEINFCYKKYIIQISAESTLKDEVWKARIDDVKNIFYNGNPPSNTILYCLNGELIVYPNIKMNREYKSLLIPIKKKNSTDSIK